MTIANVSQKTFDALKARMTSTHQTTVTQPLVVADGGHIIGHGVTADYIYSAEAKTLQVTIVHHPFWLTVSEILKSLLEIIKAIAPADEIPTVLKTA